MLGRRGAGGINVGLGFNLMGLLLVVVILGISAVVAVSSLGGNTSGKQSDGSGATTIGTSATEIGGIANQGAIAACEADASEVQTAIQDYSALHGVAPAAVTAPLLTTGPSPFLVSFPSSPDFAISIVSGVVMIAAPTTSTPVAYGTSGACAKAGS